MSKKDDKIVQEMCDKANMLLACLRARKEIEKRKQSKENQDKEKQQ